MKSILKRFRATIFGLLLTVLSISMTTSVHAQMYTSNPFMASYFQPKFGVSFANYFNHKDYILDFGIGFDEVGYDFSIMLNGSFRPYYKNVRFKTDDHFFIQANEKIFYFSIDLEKRFYFLRFGSFDNAETKAGVYLALKSGYYWGTYKGISANRNEQFLLGPSAGLSVEFGDFARVNLGYMFLNYNNLEETIPHYAHVKLAFFIGKKNQD